MTNCEQLLNDAVAAYDESVAANRKRKERLVREAFNKIFPDWDSDCVTMDDKGVTISGGIRLELRCNYINDADYFMYSARRDNNSIPLYHSVPVTNLSDFGNVVNLHREQEEKTRLYWEEVKELIEARDARIAERNAALDAYEKKRWLERLFMKRPG